MINIEKTVKRLLLAALSVSVIANSTCVFADSPSADDIVASSVVMKVGFANSYVFGEEKPIDSNTNVVPVIVSDRTFVPLRFISENFGAEVGYNESDRSITVTSDGKTAVLQVDSNLMSVGDEKVTLDAAPFINSDRTLVPVRAVSEAIGKSVAWHRSGIVAVGNISDISDEAAQQISGMFKKAAPDVTGEEYIKETDVEDNFTKFFDRKYIFASGNINPKEGAIELTVKPQKDSVSLSSSHYWWPFQILPIKKLQRSDGLLMTCSCNISNENPNTGVRFVYYTDTERYAAYATELKYDAFEQFNLAFTWKAGDSIKVYKNGVELASAPMQDGVADEFIPYAMHIARQFPWGTSQARISTKGLTAAELEKDSSKPFERTSDTSCIIDNNMDSAHYYETNWHTSSKYSMLVPIYNEAKQVFRFGQENTIFPLAARNSSGAAKDYTVKVEVTDSLGNNALTAEKTVSVPSDGMYHTYEWGLPLTNVDYYDVHTTITLDGKTVNEIDSNMSIILANEESVADGKYAKAYGQQMAYGYDMDVFTKLGASITREMSTFKWDEIEPEKGRFEWDRSDGYVEEARKKGVEVLATLGWTPIWAGKELTAEQKAAFSYVYEDIPSANLPRDWDEYANYVYQTVSRYKDVVKYWEIGNEVNFCAPYCNLSFAGTVDDYYKMLSVAYEAVKRADPTAVVSTAGFSGNTPGVTDFTGPERLAYECDTTFKDGYFDIFAFHSYDGLKLWEPLMKSIQEKRPDAELWQNEEMAFTISNPEQQAYVGVGKYSQFMVAGCDRYFQFGTPDFECFVTKYTRSPGLSYQPVATYNSLIRKCDENMGKLEGFPHEKNYSINGVFKRTDGKYLTFVGTETGVSTFYFENKIDAAYDMYGKDVAVGVDGDNNYATCEKVLYVITDDMPKIADVKTGSVKQYISNSGFEDNEGDIAGGLSTLRVGKWTVNDEQSGITDDSNSGKYAMFMKANSGEKVTASQSINLTKAGSYEFKANIKKLSGSAKLSLGVSVKNNSTQVEETSRLSDFGDSYGEYSCTFDIMDDSDSGSEIILTLSGDGEIAVDDVSLTADGESSEDKVNFVSDGGLENGIGNTVWTLSYDGVNGKTTYMPGEGVGGSNAAMLAASGSGQLLLKQVLYLNQTGKYKISAKYKAVDGTNIVPYVALWDRGNDKWATTDLRAVPKLYAYKYKEISCEYDAEEVSKESCYLYIGVFSGEGTVMVDDIAIELIE